MENMSNTQNGEAMRTLKISNFNVIARDLDDRVIYTHAESDCLIGEVREDLMDHTMHIRVLQGNTDNCIAEFEAELKDGVSPEEGEKAVVGVILREHIKAASIELIGNALNRLVDEMKADEDNEPAGGLTKTPPRTGDTVH